MLGMYEIMRKNNIFNNTFLSKVVSKMTKKHTVQNHV
jgi:hypothetical protein